MRIAPPRLVHKSRTQPGATSRAPIHDDKERPLPCPAKVRSVQDRSPATGRTATVDDQAEFGQEQGSARLLIAVVRRRYRRTLACRSPQEAAICCAPSPTPKAGADSIAGLTWKTRRRRRATWRFCYFGKSNVPVTLLQPRHVPSTNGLRFVIGSTCNVQAVCRSIHFGPSVPQVVVSQLHFGTSMPFGPGGPPRHLALHPQREGGVHSISTHCRRSMMPRPNGSYWADCCRTRRQASWLQVGRYRHVADVILSLRRRPRVTPMPAVRNLRGRLAHPDAAVLHHCVK